MVVYNRTKYLINTIGGVELANIKKLKYQWDHVFFIHTIANKFENKNANLLYIYKSNY